MAQELDQYGNPTGNRQTTGPDGKPITDPNNPAPAAPPSNEPDWANVETQLKARGKNAYGADDLEGAKRNYYNTGADGKSGGNLDAILNDMYSRYDQRNSSQRSGGNETSDGSGQQPAMSSWLGSSANTNPYLQQQTDLMKQMYDRQLAMDAQNKQRGDALYSTLSQRANQGLNVNAQDPIIANQVNSYRAEQERGARNSIDAMAESSGPLANLNGQRRLALENAAQSTGSMQAQLVGRELQSRRDEIAQALAQQGGMLNADQQMQLQSQLAQLDQAMKGQSLALQDKLGTSGLNNDLLRMMLQNQQFNSNLGSENDQFAAQYGLNSADRASYWDAVNRGILK